MKRRLEPLAIHYFPSFTNFAAHDGARELLGNSFVHYIAACYDSHERVAAMARDDRTDYALMRKLADAQVRGVKPRIQVEVLGPTPYWQPAGMCCFK